MERTERTKRNKMPLSSPLCRGGSKRRIRETIKRLSPEFKTYVEPFVGSAAIYFFMDIGDRKAVLNDTNEIVISSLKIIKSNPSIENIEKFRGASREDIQSFVSRPHTSAIDKLASNIYTLCNTFGNIGFGEIYTDIDLTNKLKKIPQYADYMKNTIVTKGDWTSTLKYDSPDTFFFIDPPYEKSEGIYKDYVVDYNDMSERLKKIKGKFMLTLNDSKNIRDTFSSFNIRGISVKGKGNKGIGISTRKELIITNY